MTNSPASSSSFRHTNAKFRRSGIFPQPDLSRRDIAETLTPPATTTSISFENSPSFTATSADVTAPTGYIFASSSTSATLLFTTSPTPGPTSTLSLTSTSPNYSTVSDQSTSTEAFPSGAVDQPVSSGGSTTSTTKWIIIGAILSFVALLAIIIAFLLCWRKQKRQARELRRWRMEKSYVDSSDTPRLTANTVGRPDAAGIEPYIIPPTPSLQPSQKGLSPPGITTPPKIVNMLFSSSSPGGVTPTSATEQQSVLEQLTALREQIARMEALTRNGGSSTSGGGVDASEPPPEYDIRASTTIVVSAFPSPAPLSSSLSSREPHNGRPW